MYVFGGHGGSGVFPNNLLNDVFILNLITNVWTKPTTSGTIPSGRRRGTLIVYGDSMILFGGRTDEQTYTNDVYTLDLTTYKFTKLSTPGTSPSKRVTKR